MNLEETTMSKLVALPAVMMVAASGQNLKPEQIGDAMPVASILQISAPNPAGATARLAGPGGPALAEAPVAAGGPVLALRHRGERRRHLDAGAQLVVDAAGAAHLL
jgi:hypothetical protein